jgi:hypothetical protein
VGDILKVIGSFEHSHYNSCSCIDEPGLLRSVGFQTNGIAN